MTKGSLLALLIGFSCGLALARGAQPTKEREPEIAQLVVEAAAFEAEVRQLKVVVVPRSVPRFVPRERREAPPPKKPDPTGF